MENDDVYQGEDGYWRVRGLPETTYYADRETAERVLAETKASDREMSDEDDYLDSEHDLGDDEDADQITETE